MRNIAKIVLINIAALFGLVVTFDIAAYFLLPYRFVAQFEGYRFVPAPGVIGRGHYPKGYFVAHAERGFDIGPNRTAQHWVNGQTHSIWSNSLGCFDREQNGQSPYIYLAGDSFTWGYVPFDHNIGTLIEQRTDRTIFKCGVTHSGQRHQYDKLVEIIDKVGRKPQAMLVFYFSNDVANDFAYPHSTVLDGWQIDKVFINEKDQLIRPSPAELSERMTEVVEMVETQKNGHGFLAKTKMTIKRYSLSVSIVDALKDTAQGALSPPSLKREFNEWGGRSINFLTTSEADGRYNYTNNLHAKPNQHAILEFKRLADYEGIGFAMVLIPPKNQAINPIYYEELRVFLEANNIRHLDLSEAFAERGIETSEIYWEFDGHLNAHGNSLVATLLIETLPDILAPLEQGAADQSASR